MYKRVFTVFCFLLALSGLTCMAASIPQMEQQLQARPNDIPTHILAARAYLARNAKTNGDLADAQRHTDAILKLDASNFDGLMLAGQIARQRGDLRGASNFYRRAADASPNNPSAQLALGGVLDQLGDVTGAHAAYQRFRALQGMKPTR